MQKNKKIRTIQCLQKIASKLVLSLPTASYKIWLLRQLFCQVQLFPAIYSSKFKDRLSSEKKTSFNQVHLGTVFANLLSPSFMCIMLVMPEKELGGYGIYICLFKQNFEQFFKNFRGTKNKKRPKIILKMCLKKCFWPITFLSFLKALTCPIFFVLLH